MHLEKRTEGDRLRFVSTRVNSRGEAAAILAESLSCVNDRQEPKKRSAQTTTVSIYSSGSRRPIDCVTMLFENILQFVWKTQ